MGHLMMPEDNSRGVLEAERGSFKDEIERLAVD
jgi:hypothetical protein